MPRAKIAMRFTAPHINSLGNTVMDTSYTESIAPTCRTNTSGVLMGVVMIGTLTVGSAAGTMQLQWAQHTSNATGTIVHAGSSLELWRIS